MRSAEVVAAVCSNDVEPCVDGRLAETRLRGVRSRIGYAESMPRARDECARKMCELKVLLKPRYRARTLRRRGSQ